MSRGNLNDEVEKPVLMAIGALAATAILAQTAPDSGFIGKFAASGGLEDLNKAPYHAGAHRAHRVKVAKVATPQAAGLRLQGQVAIGPVA